MISTENVSKLSDTDSLFTYFFTEFRADFQSVVLYFVYCTHDMMVIIYFFLLDRHTIQCIFYNNKIT